MILQTLVKNSSERMLSSPLKQGLIEAGTQEKDIRKLSNVNSLLTVYRKLCYFPVQNLASLARVKSSSSMVHTLLLFAVWERCGILI